MTDEDSLTSNAFYEKDPIWKSVAAPLGLVTKRVKLDVGVVVEARGDFHSNHFAMFQFIVKCIRGEVVYVDEEHDALIAFSDIGKHWVHWDDLVTWFIEVEGLCAPDSTEKVAQMWKHLFELCPRFAWSIDTGYGIEKYMWAFLAASFTVHG